MRRALALAAAARGAVSAAAPARRAAFASTAAPGGGADPSSSSPPPPPSGPLVGYRVLDVGQVVAGNFAGALLAYFGADVIKIEPPGTGDALRHLRDLDATGTALWWRAHGRNRRCVTADLRQVSGRDVVRRLAATADVLVENFRPGQMEKWGLGPADLSPDLVYTRISGYGQTGPRRHLPGYASVCEAYGGLRHLNGYADRAPVRPNISLGDSLAGLHAAFGAALALLARDGPRARAAGAAGAGAGQVVDAAISESVFNMLEAAATEFGATGAVRGPSGATITGVVPSGTWRAACGAYVVIGGNGNSIYDRLMTAIGRPDLGLENERYATDSARVAHEGEIVAAIAAWVAARPADAAVAAMDAARVPAGRILSIADIAADAQYAARGMLERVAAPGGGEAHLLPALLPVLAGTPGTTRWAGPELGAHTEEVLCGELGMSAAELAELRAAGAV